MLHGVQQVFTGLRICGTGNIFNTALRYQSSAPLARARANVNDVIGASDGVLIMLYHHQRIAFVAQFLQRVQQDLIVTRMQTNGGFVKHIAHTLQVAAQLRGQPDALRFAAAECGRTTV